MIVRLVRHGRAGHKRDWVGDDALRPLDARGEKQAAALVRLLADEPPGRVLSSPLQRCVQTVEPLALRWDVKVETTAALGPDSGPGEVLQLLRHRQPGDVLCTHGEVMGALLERLRFAGAEIVGAPADLLGKGTLWELTLNGGKVQRLHHVDPLDERTELPDGQVNRR